MTVRLSATLPLPSPLSARSPRRAIPNPHPSPTSCGQRMDGGQAKPGGSNVQYRPASARSLDPHPHPRSHGPYITARRPRRTDQPISPSTLQPNSSPLASFRTRIHVTQPVHADVSEPGPIISLRSEQRWSNTEPPYSRPRSRFSVKPYHGLPPERTRVRAGLQRSVQCPRPPSTVQQRC
jgi:hypothetical protein